MRIGVGSRGDEHRFLATSRLNASVAGAETPVRESPALALVDALGSN
jgi:hypothetical protein